MELDMPKIFAIHTEIESIGPMDTNSTEAIIEIDTRIAGYLPYTGQQMALAKKIMLQKRTKLYDNLVFNYTARGLMITPTMAKDYVNGKVAEEQYNYDICERCNRSIVHVLDYLRSVLSTLKEEMKISQYNNFNT